MTGRSVCKVGVLQWPARLAGYVVFLTGLTGLLWTQVPSAAGAADGFGAASADHLRAADAFPTGASQAAGFWAGASGGSVDAVGVVDVVEVAGHLDGILADFIERSIDAAEARGSLALVLQVDSSRATMTDERLAALADRVVASRVPVTMWVGPSGAVAEGAAGQLAGIVEDLALAPGSHIGALGRLVVDEQHLTDRFAAAYPRLREQVVSAEQATGLGLARQAPTLPFFVLDIPGFRSDIDTTGDEPVRVPVSRVRFSKLSLLDQFMHTASSPAVAYLMLLAGGVLLVFEFYTAGVGIAGVAGAAAFMLGCYGLAVQPVRAWALVLLAVAVFGYCVDIQTGLPRAWTAIATVCLTAGSIFLYDDGVAAGWVTLTAGILGVATAMAAGMPTMVRARFSTPTIGREWMIGALGTAVEKVDPEGVVMIGGAPWRARTHRSTPILPDQQVEVVAIEGLALTVAPAGGTESAPTGSAPV